jgi:hypothetical protein
VNADLSVAPEIAQLAAPLAIVPAPQRPAQGAPQTPYARRSIPTTGQLAAALSQLAAAPQRWWDLVRFSPGQPARIAVPAPFEAWLLVIPPGQAAECHCELATQIAGEAVEESGRTGRQPRQGRVLVHAPGSQHVIRSAGHGYSVTLHAGRRA